MDFNTFLATTARERAPTPCNDPGEGKVAAAGNAAGRNSLTRREFRRPTLTSLIQEQQQRAGHCSHGLAGCSSACYFVSGFFFPPFPFSRSLSLLQFAAHSAWPIHFLSRAVLCTTLSGVNPARDVSQPASHPSTPCGRRPLLVLTSLPRVNPAPTICNAFGKKKNRTNLPTQRVIIFQEHVFTITAVDCTHFHVSRV